MTTNKTTTQDPTPLTYTTNKSHRAGHQQSSGGQVLSNLQSSLMGAQTNGQVDAILKQVEHGSGKINQTDTANINISDDISANDIDLCRRSKVDERLRNEDGGQVKMDAMPFFVDSAGSGNPIETGFPPPTIPSSFSLSDSGSEDEVIVFSGRNRGKSGTTQSATFTKLSTPKCVEDDMIFQPPSTSVPASQMMLSKPENSKLLSSSRNSKSQANRRKGSNKPERLSMKTTEEDEVLADYIANLKANDGADDPLDFLHPKQRDLDVNAWERDSLVGDEKIKERQDSNNDWDSVDLQDFDGFSTSSEVMDVTPHIFAKRLRNSTLQYLVTRRDEPVEEAKWLPPSLLKAKDAADIIALFEDKESSKYDHQMEDADDSDVSSAFGSLLDMDLAEDMRALEAEKNLEDRRKARMSDEQVVMLLSKQAELGIIGDELVLFNGDGLAAASSDDGRAGLSKKSRAVASPYSLRSHVPKTKQFKTSFPSATILADVLEKDPYNGFDIMDRERPSLRKKPRKGARAEMMLDLSDTEIQESLNAAWGNDRAKKKQRKQEREQLRAEGLLNKKSKPDLKAKFSEGMTIADVRSEIKAFLMTSAQSQALPPMGHNERKAVHGIANQSGLRSKSVGSGITRFPVLYKTSRTKALTIDLEARIDAISMPTKFLPRLDRARRSAAPRARNTQGGLTPSASYRDGEVVGIGAPELGTENKGRAMLEKMGWSTGTALGAVDNKGIAQPIAQIVKTSKAGLG